MKTIGLLGGMTWHSSVVYYRRINERVHERLGGSHSARSILASVDFADIERLQEENRWDEAGEMLARAAQQLERGGADLLVLCTNTMHREAARISAAVGIPLLHIVDATARAIREQKLDCVGLLGTAYTMDGAFYRERLLERFGIRALVPSSDERAEVHRVIYEELTSGRLIENSRARYREVVEGLRRAGAQGIILGCTEIGLLLSANDCPGLPLFDTAQLHADAAVEWALEG